MTGISRVLLPGSQDASISRLIYGTWRLADSGDSSPSSLADRIRLCLRLGITTFDLADIYGGKYHHCDALFGAAFQLLSSDEQNQCQIIGKFGIRCYDDDIKSYDTSASCMRTSVETTLSLLKRDFLDVLLIHRPDPLMNVHDVVKGMMALKQEGKVRQFGVSNFTPSHMDLLQSKLPFPLVTNQVELNVLNMDVLHDGTLDKIQQNDMVPMIWSPLAGGRIFDAQSSDPQVQRVRKCLQSIASQLNTTIDLACYAWLLMHPSNMAIVLGTNELKRIEDSVKAFRVDMTKKQWFAIWEASKGSPVP